MEEGERGLEKGSRVSKLEMIGRLMDMNVRLGV